MCGPEGALLLLPTRCPAGALRSDCADARARSPEPFSAVAAFRACTAKTPSDVPPTELKVPEMSLATRSLTYALLALFCRGSWSGRGQVPRVRQDALPGATHDGPRRGSTAFPPSSPKPTSSAGRTRRTSVPTLRSVSDPGQAPARLATTSQPRSHQDPQPRRTRHGHPQVLAAPAKTSLQHHPDQRPSSEPSSLSNSPPDQDGKDPFTPSAASRPPSRTYPPPRTPCPAR